MNIEEHLKKFDRIFVREVNGKPTIRPEYYDQIRIFLKQAMERMEISTLKKYTNFLLNHNYVDDDVWCEEPTAIDRYLKTKKKQGFYSQLPDKEKEKICLACLKKVAEEQEKIMKKVNNKEL